MKNNFREMQRIRQAQQAQQNNSYVSAQVGDLQKAFQQQQQQLMLVSAARDNLIRLMLCVVETYGSSPAEGEPKRLLISAAKILGTDVRGMGLDVQKEPDGDAVTLFVRTLAESPLQPGEKTDVPIPVEGKPEPLQRAKLVLASSSKPAPSNAVDPFCTCTHLKSEHLGGFGKCKLGECDCTAYLEVMSAPSTQTIN